jgi:glycosyltransferase involved in cell wall biosynthesis
LRLTEAAVRRGQGVAKAVMALRQRGFVPDLVCVHQGWGESLYLKDVLPGVPILAYCEFYYHGAGVDVGFDPEFPSELDNRLQVRTRNAIHALSLLDADRGLSPTAWQHSLFPPELRAKIAVIHDGIDTARVAPDAAARFAVGENGPTFRAGDAVITYVARNLEPYRGFHVLMRALPEILRRRPDAHVVIVGGDRVSYGSRPKAGGTWRQVMLEEVGSRLDRARVHFVGNLPYERYLDLLQVSKAHVYLTYPFVLSWSMLEAMAAGCLVIGSATPPVEEVIVDRKDGLLVDFFSPQQLADAVDVALSDGEEARAIRQEARRTIVERYDLRACIAAQWRLVESLVAAQVAGKTEGRRAAKAPRS